MIIKINNCFFQSNKSILVFLAVIIFAFTANSQTTYTENTEIGVLGGVSYYLGDLNKNHFYQPVASGGLVIRRNIDR